MLKAQYSDSTSEKLQTIEPIAIFRDLDGEKAQERKQCLQALLKKLKGYYPDSLKIGAAVKTGDCFFDAVAQGLNELNIKPNYRFTAKSLRKDCKEYVKKSGKQATFFYNAIVQDAEVSGYAMPDEGNANNNFRTFDNYYENIENMASEGIRIWGRPEIEGKIISNKYGIDLYCYSMNEEYGQKITVTKITKNSDETNCFIEGDNPDELQIDSSQKSVRVLGYRKHFVPLLRSPGGNVDKDEVVSREEIYGEENVVYQQSESQSVSLDIDSHRPVASRKTMQVLGDRETDSLNKNIIDDGNRNTRNNDAVENGQVLLDSQFGSLSVTDSNESSQSQKPGLWRRFLNWLFTVFNKFRRSASQKPPVVRPLNEEISSPRYGTRSTSEQQESSRAGFWLSSASVTDSNESSPLIEKLASSRGAPGPKLRNF